MRFEVLREKILDNPLDSFWYSTVPLIIFPVISLSIFGVLVFINANYIDEVFDNTVLSKTFKVEIRNESESVEILEYEKQELQKGKGEPFTFLLLGIDSKNINVGRSDAIMFGVAEPEKNKIYLLSMPRDSWVYSTSSHKHDKLTHVYTSGVDSTVSTIEKVLNTPIDYYATIDFKGFEDLVDSVGGVNLDIKEGDRFFKKLNKKEKKRYKSGKNLKGSEVLKYVRFRGGPRGDFGRNDRQRVAMVALINELKGAKLSELSEHLEVIKKHFRTNMTPYHMYHRHAQFQDANKVEIETLDISKKAKVGREGRMSVVYLNQEVVSETINKIHSIMGFNE